MLAVGIGVAYGGVCEKEGVKEKNCVAMLERAACGRHELSRNERHESHGSQSDAKKKKSGRPQKLNMVSVSHLR